ncbi:hypothetical protein K525DRAFT_176566, partial [Schizophyllum commune Loenen D]
VRIVLEVLARERFYLGVNKLHFLEPEVRVLGRIIDSQGIRVDPSRVDEISKWPTPTNKRLLRGFCGAVGW